VKKKVYDFEFKKLKKPKVEIFVGGMTTKKVEQATKKGGVLEEYRGTVMDNEQKRNFFAGNEGILKK